jgi:DNA processing protein
MIIHQIALTLVPGIGCKNAKKLVSYCGGVDAVFTGNSKKLLKIPGIGDSTVNALSAKNLIEIMKRAEKETRFIEKNGINPVFYLDKTYPERLKHCIDSPIMLYYKGNADLNANRIISIVGTRRNTPYGKWCCQKIVEELSDYEVLVVSGLAYGIDSCSHKVALDKGLMTVGILAHGLDMIYPALNKSLAERMLVQGGLLTEFISATQPDRMNFPKRNRIIAGMSDAVVVIEAGKKGGALITAEIANSYNRDVFAVPGRVNDFLSEGCNHLIKTNQAALIHSAQDIVYMMGWENEAITQKQPQTMLFCNLTPEEDKIIKLLEVNGESSMDWLSLSMEIPVSKVASALLNLEFKGIVKSLPGKMFRLQ